MDERNQPVRERDSENGAGTDGAAGARALDKQPVRFGALVREAVVTRGLESYRLAIEALPDEVAELASGRFYAIYAKPRTAACDALIWASAKAARTRHVTVVLSRTRAQVAARMRLLGFRPGVPAQGWPRDLNVLAMPDERSGRAGGETPASAPSERRVAFAHLFGGLRALKRFGFRSNALYFVEGAERWLSWGDPDALAREGRLLANWCEARRVALVLLLDPSALGRAPAERDETVDAFMTDDLTQRAGHLEFHGACAGMARMGHTHGELLWHVDFWRTGRALATGETRALRFTEDGRLSVAPDVVDVQAQTALRLARDETRVVATRAVVARESWVPPEWEIVDDQQAAVAACVAAQAATVLLDYRDRSTLEALCSAVHTLRRECGRALKIVIVERREALRHQYELLLLSLGANLVIGRELPFSRVQSLLRSLQGQLDTRPVASDYQAALAAALTDDVRGYLRVPAFCERIEAVLARGAVLDLPHVLAKIALLPNVSHAQAFKQCAPRRAGDVATADAAHLYVFLFACRLPDADIALRHIFTTPIEDLSDRVVYLAEASIEREVKALAETNRRAPIADFSDLFPTASEREPRPHSAPANETAVAPAGDAASQLQAVESMLDELNRAEGASTRTTPDSARPGAAPTARSTSRAPAFQRSAEPWAMPVRRGGGTK